MSSKRVEAIKTFAEAIAKYIADSGRAKLLVQLSLTKKSWEFRNILVKALRSNYSQNQELLFTFEQYMDTFEDDSGTGIADWALTRDLLLIRLFQRCHELKLNLGEVAAELDRAEKDEDRDLAGASSEDEE